MGIFDGLSHEKVLIFYLEQMKSQEHFIFDLQIFALQTDDNWILNLYLLQDSHFLDIWVPVRPELDICYCRN